MTDPRLMDADCIHGVTWYECKRCVPGHWTVEDRVDGPELVWHWTGVESVRIDRKYVRRISPTAFDALVAAVRDQARIPQLEADADTLRQARELAEQALTVPFGSYSVWRDSGDAEAAERMSNWERARDALLDLLSSPAPQGASPSVPVAPRTEGLVISGKDSHSDHESTSDPAPQGEGTQTTIECCYPLGEYGRCELTLGHGGDHAGAPQGEGTE